MKPILCMVTYNRLYETKVTINYLLETASFNDVDFYIIDNCSTEIGMKEYLESINFASIIFENKNIGCPSALNKILKKREKGQHFIKLDNDIKIKTTNWLEKWLELIDKVPGLALLGGAYPKAFDYNRFIMHNNTDNLYWSEVYPIMGHFMFHNGNFLDNVGYFDVLSQNHVYGYEDLLMCHKAKCLGLKTGIKLDVEIENFQTLDSYADFAGDTKEDHTEKMLPHYLSRLKLISEGNIYTMENGYPEC